MEKKKCDVFDIKLDSDEQQLLESIEQGEWRTVRISSGDLDRLKQCAAYKRLSY